MCKITRLSDLGCLHEICWGVYTSCDSNPSGHIGLRFLYMVQRGVLSILGLSPHVLPVMEWFCYPKCWVCIKNVHTFSLFKQSFISDF